MSAPFTQDTANQAIQVKSFMALLQDIAGNNAKLRAVGDQAQAVARGQMAMAFHTHHAEICESTEANSRVLSGITDSLNTGMRTVAAQEELGASYFHGTITG